MADDQAPKMKTCPCCGKETLQEVPEPAEQLAQHYIACIATGVPFNYTYALYDGAISVTISNLSTADSAVLQRDIPRLKVMNKECGYKLDEDMVGALDAQFDIYSIIQSIQIESSGKAYSPKDNVMACLGLVDKAFSEAAKGEYRDVLETVYGRMTDVELLSAVPFAVLSGVVAAHFRVYDVLVNYGFDENFWGRIRLA